MTNCIVNGIIVALLVMFNVNAGQLPSISNHLEFLRTTGFSSIKYATSALKNNNPILSQAEYSWYCEDLL